MAITVDRRIKRVLDHKHIASDVTGVATDSSLTTHINNTSNPHSVTASQLGLENITSKGVDYTATTTDRYIYVTTTLVTITLPAVGVMDGRIISVKALVDNVYVTSADLIDGEVTQTLMTDDNIIMISTGTTWLII